MLRALLVVAVFLASATLPASSWATFPGANGALAYTVYSGSPTDPNRPPPRIDRYDPSGKDLGSLGGEAGKLQYFSYSPDGSRVVGWLSSSSPARPSGIYVGGPDGGGLTAVYTGPFAQPMFLADGRIALFRTTSGGGTISVLNPEGVPEAGSFAAVTIPPGVYSIEIAPDMKTAYYVQAAQQPGSPDQLVAVDLASGAGRVVLSLSSNGGLPVIGLVDISPSSQQLMVSIASTGEKSGGDRLAPYALHLVNADGSNLTPLATKAGSRPTGAFSPDGRLVGYVGDNETYDAAVGAGTVEVRVMELDGSNDRRFVSYPPGSHAGFGQVYWQPGPPLIADITGGQLYGDLTELDMSVENVSGGAIGGLTYATSGHAAGLVFNMAPFPAGERAGIEVLAGPSPALLETIAPRTKSVHQYLVGVNRPGSTQVRTVVTGTSAKTGTITADQTRYIVATNRDFSPAEERMAFYGGTLTLQSEVDDAARDVYAGSIKSVSDALDKALPKGKTRSRAKKTSAMERELAQRAGLPDDGLAWLPSSTPKAIKAFVAYEAAKHDAKQKVVKRKLGDAYKTSIQTPFDFWSDQWHGAPETGAWWVDALAEEGSYWSGKVTEEAKGYATRAQELLGDPAKQDQFKAEVYRTAGELKVQLNEFGETAPSRARKVAREIAKNPVKGARAMGTLQGTVEAEVGFVVAETLIGRDRKAVVRGVGNIGNEARQAVKLVEGVEDAGRTLKSAAVLRTTDDVLPTVAKLGMPAADERRWATMVSKLEESAKARGYDVDLELSFRPRNEFSAGIKDGLGKNMFIKKGKAGNELDLMLGMDKSGLGQYAVYSPKLPKGFKDLPPSMQEQLKQRATDMKAAYKEWYDPKSAVGKARRKNGVELTSKIGELPGNTNDVTKIKFKLTGKRKNGTTLVEYKELTVDGKKILKRGAKPRPVVSDYDGNAILQAGGRELPPGIKGFLELETMRLSRESGGHMPVSFHGFTHNGFDVGAATYRQVFKFVLEGMDEKQAQKHLTRYLGKFRSADPLFNDKLDAYKYGDYVVRVTSGGATVGQGL